MSSHDVLILGSSPNALAAAARLAAAGRKVLVLETRDTVGGPVATEAFVPGFRADTGVASATLDPEIARALGSHVEVVRRDSVTALSATPVTLRELPAMPPAVAQAVELLRAMYRQSPPDLPRPPLADAAALADLAARLGAPGPRAMHEVLRLLFMPARDFVDEQPWTPAVRALVAGAALRGASEGPFASGTLFGLLHLLATDDGLFRNSAVGGVQAIAQALADRARALGAEIRTGVEGPVKIELDGSAARGARLASGELLLATAVFSDHDARTTFTHLVSPAALEPEFNRAVRAVRCAGTVARVHLALSGLPRFAGVEPDALRGTLVVAPDVASLERAWDCAKRGTPSQAPYIEVTLPTLADPRLAPEGHHVLSAWVQHVPQGAERKLVLKSVLDALLPFAPDLIDKVRHSKVALPEELEERFGVTGGHLYGGPIRLESAFFLRPVPGFAHYRTPIEGLYLCGSAAHPGGYTGLAGWNAAGQLL